MALYMKYPKSSRNKKHIVVPEALLTPPNSLSSSNSTSSGSLSSNSATSGTERKSFSSGRKSKRYQGHVVSISAVSGAPKRRTKITKKSSSVASSISTSSDSDSYKLLEENVINDNFVAAERSRRFSLSLCKEINMVSVQWDLQISKYIFLLP